MRGGGSFWQYGLVVESFRRWCIEEGGSKSAVSTSDVDGVERLGKSDGKVGKLGYCVCIENTYMAFVK